MLKTFTILALVSSTALATSPCDKALSLCDSLQKEQDKAIIMLKERNSVLEDELVDERESKSVSKITYFLTGTIIGVLGIILLKR